MPPLKQDVIELHVVDVGGPHVRRKHETRRVRGKLLCVQNEIKVTSLSLAVRELDWLRVAGHARKVNYKVIVDLR